MTGTIFDKTNVFEQSRPGIVPEVAGDIKWKFWQRLVGFSTISYEIIEFSKNPMILRIPKESYKNLKIS